MIQGIHFDNLKGLIQRYEELFLGVTELAVENRFIMPLLLSFQKERKIAGSLLEIGVNKAGTAAILACFLSDTERLILVDPYMSTKDVKQSIQDFSGITPEKLTFIKGASKLLAKRIGNQECEGCYPLRFAHIDGEHSYDAVYNDILFAHKSLTEGGLIVIDDFFNINSACVTEAVFDYIHSCKDLHLVAMGYGKAYLCESRSLRKYRSWFIRLPDKLATFGFNVRLCFNAWAFERTYVTMSECPLGEPRYQVIGNRFFTLAEAIAAL